MDFTLHVELKETRFSPCTVVKKGSVYEVKNNNDLIQFPQGFKWAKKQLRIYIFTTFRIKKKNLRTTSNFPSAGPRCIILTFIW